MPLISKEFAVGEVADESAVGGQEVVAGQAFEGDPADVVEDVIDDFALKGANGKELEVYCSPVAVGVMNTGDKGTDLGADSQFLVELASESLLGSFAGLDFTAGELPLEGHGLVDAALADENGVTAKNERGSDVADRLSLILLNIGVHALTV